MKKIVMNSLILSGTLFAQNVDEICKSFDKSSINTKGR